MWNLEVLKQSNLNACERVLLKDLKDLLQSKNFAGFS